MLLNLSIGVAFFKVPKEHHKTKGFTYSLPIPQSIWEDLSMDFILRLPLTQRKVDNILVAVDMFSKIAHFLPYTKAIDATYVAYPFFKEISRLHGVSKTITLDLDVKFTNHFQMTLLKRFDRTL